ncbi:hypothetical protein [Streptomyces netropsis]|uniref:Uncharacterized protein n=1 Tax=Streptomyces netropsis TaxID=55404 RepID=A0A7W7PGC8_STRNE|nr:hypothetical protein [Streptomyces netropsis]MBB4888093.1 hypothetical protein [Streptomyces netropsis]GGR32094.1 hypothetical protein GCM10010219_41130 [Streptomyces netropsis]
MEKREADLLTLLRELDGPERLEWPRRYNHTKTAALFSGLVARLEDDFTAHCTAEKDSQDSSEYGRAAIPAKATMCGTPIVVCVSKFGSLALVCAKNPGAFFSTQDAQAELDSADLTKVNRALVDLGYTVAPEELLASDYNGPASCLSTFSGPAGGTVSSAPSKGAAACAGAAVPATRAAVAMVAAVNAAICFMMGL